jgi:hypothetical protein
MFFRPDVIGSRSEMASIRVYREPSAVDGPAEAGRHVLKLLVQTPLLLSATTRTR